MLRQKLTVCLKITNRKLIWGKLPEEIEDKLIKSISKEIEHLYYLWNRHTEETWKLYIAQQVADQLPEYRLLMKAKREFCIKIHELKKQIKEEKNLLKNKE